MKVSVAGPQAAGETQARVEAQEEKRQRQKIQGYLKNKRAYICIHAYFPGCFVVSDVSF